jgi:hypothetical protein
MAGHGGLDTFDAADWGPGGEMGGQKRSYFMWVNSKLMEGGWPTITFDSMYDDLNDGIVFSNLIRTLSTGANVKKFPSGISGIEKRPLHPLAAGSNFRLLWSYLDKVEKVPGGTNGLPVPSMLKGDPTYMMGAIFKLMQHYSIGQESDPDPNSPVGKLLEWVKPRCVPHKDVKNFGSSFKDGKAIVALWNYLITEDAQLYEWLKKKNGQELTIDIDKATTDTENAMNTAFSRFNKMMQVPLMVTANDMMNQDIHFKGTNNVYVAEIRNSYLQWYDDMKKKFDLENEEQSKDIENINMGLDKFEEAMEALRKAQRDSTTLTTEIVNVADNEMSQSGGTDSEFDTICDDARGKLSPNDDQYDYAHKLFGEASNYFKQIKGRTARDLDKKWKFKEKLSECTKYGDMCDTYKDSTHDNLDVKLDELRKYWSAKKLLDMTLEEYNQTVSTIEDNYNNIVDKTIRSFEGTKTHRQRRENFEKGRKEVIDEISKILPYKEKFADIETKVSSDDDRQICNDKIEECDTYYNYWLNDYDRRIKQELESDKYKDEEEVGDLLAIYHKFSVDLDTIVSKNTNDTGALIPAADPGISTDYNEIKSRLQEIASHMQNFQAMEENLRSKVQKAVDAKFDKHNLPGKAWYAPNDAV